jgi:hypothetical protein
MAGTIGIWLRAGLGNQLFMLFATVSYAIDHNIKYGIYAWKNRVIGNRKAYWDNFLKYFENNVIEYQSAVMMYQEPEFHYVPLPDDLTKNNFVLDGYFQSPKYFEHNFDKISEMIQLRKKIADVKAKYQPIIDFNVKKYIAMHFRMDDYMTMQYNHPIQQPEYYIKAMKELAKDLSLRGDDISNYNILYFCQESDDSIVNQYLNVIKKHVPEFNGLFVKMPNYVEDWEQMLLMACCDHFIIANSTFSWFGAYFCDKQTKKVYWPASWFGPSLSHKKTQDLCPEGWQKIE